MGGNLRPSFTFFYDWHGRTAYPAAGGLAVLGPVCGERALQRALTDAGTVVLGFLNRKDSVWVEFQYLLY